MNIKCTQANGQKQLYRPPFFHPHHQDVIVLAIAGMQDVFPKDLYTHKYLIPHPAQGTIGALE